MWVKYPFNRFVLLLSKQESGLMLLTRCLIFFISGISFGGQKVIELKIFIFSEFFNASYKWKSWGSIINFYRSVFFFGTLITWSLIWCKSASYLLVYSTWARLKKDRFNPNLSYRVWYFFWLPDNDFCRFVSLFKFTRQFYKELSEHK